jgi:hypothetical protein
MVQRLSGMPAGDIGLLVGDLNVNSRDSSDTRISTEEYKCLIRLLAGEGIDHADINTQAESTLNLVQSWFGEEENGKLGATGSRLQVRDILYEKYGEHRITFGDVTDENLPRETVLTDKTALAVRECLDYILHISPGSFASSPGQNQLVVDLDKSEVDPMYVSNRPYTQLSGMMMFWLTTPYLCSFCLYRSLWSADCGKVGS